MKTRNTKDNLANNVAIRDKMEDKEKTVQSYFFLISNAIQVQELSEK